MSDLGLEDALAAWLKPAAPRLNPAFPPLLEAMYVQENAASKLLEMRSNTRAGLIVGVLLAPALWLIMPDAHRQLLFGYLGVALPVGLLAHILYYTALPVRWLERITALAGIVGAIAVTPVVTMTHVNIEAAYFGGIMFLTMLNVGRGGFSFPLRAGFAVTVLMIFAVGEQFLAASSSLHAAATTLLFVICSTCAVVGSWRLETATRQSWALLLRERLKRRELADHNTALAELAQRDPLTGLANRRSYESCEGSLWRQAEQAATRLGLIVVDIDRFKDYNDYYGHPAGDTCIQAVARCLSEQLRGTDDLVARVGGEEFAILLPDLTVETAGDIAERVRQAVEALELPHLGWGPSRTITISCGACSLVPCEGMSPRDLFAAADAALYAAKQGGRNMVCLADSVGLSAAAASHAASVRQG